MPPQRSAAASLDATDINERIRQLGRRRILELPQMLDFHMWLDGKRLARQSCRVVGESRTGKTISCNTYRLKSKVTQLPGEAPHIPVLYWHCPEHLSVSRLFTGLLELTHYQATRGRIPELRERVYQVLGSCQVEMIILDEAQRVNAQALSEIRDISDILEIAVVLVGTDRLNTVIQRDDQVLYRFLSAYRFSHLGPEELQEMTALWEAHILQLPEPSNLANEKVQRLLSQATRGYIGVLDHILCEAAIRTLQMGKPRITLPTLRQVVKECSLVIDQVGSSSNSSLQPWLFQVQPYPEESFGHFLGRFRRANHLSSAHLSAMLKQRPYAVSYWETPSRRRQPDASTLQHLSQLAGVTVKRLSAMRSPPGTQLHKPTRLCADCYTEVPYHKLTWQVATQPRCKIHRHRLLGACPRCSIAFRLPSYWQIGECDHCHLPFQEMRAYREP